MVPGDEATLMAGATASQVDIDLLRAREATPGDLNQTLRVRGPVLTFHLRVLASAGVISQRRRGRGRAYRLHPRILSSASQWLRPFEHA